MRFRDLRLLAVVMLPYGLLVAALPMMVFPDLPAVQVLFAGWVDTNFFRIAIQLFLFVAPIFAVGYIAAQMSGRRALSLMYRYGTRTRWFFTTVVLCLFVVMAYLIIIWALALLLDNARGNGIPWMQALLALAHTGMYLLLCTIAGMLLQLYTGNMRLSLVVAYGLSLLTELPLQALLGYARLPIHYPMLLRAAPMNPGGYAEPMGLYVMVALVLALLFLGWLLRRNTAIKEN